MHALIAPDGKDLLPLPFFVRLGMLSSRFLLLSILTTSIHSKRTKDFQALANAVSVQQSKVGVKMNCMRITRVLDLTPRKFT